MSDPNNFTLGEFTTCLLKAAERITLNYLKNASGYHHDIRDIALTYSGFYSKMLVNPAESLKIYAHGLSYLKDYQHLAYLTLWNGKEKREQSVTTTKRVDKRFSSPEWEQYPAFNFIRKNHLLFEKLCAQIIQEVDMDDKTRKKLKFYTHQYLDALSPSNFLLSNPVALKLAVQSGGKSLWLGLINLVHDLEKGRISQTDESAFEPGKNLAISQGAVVFENELMQLIQYSPTTGKVFEVPLVIIPPWINKYYILDLRPENSLVKFLIEQGITTFIISWRNPKAGMGHFNMNDYLELGALKAFEVARQVCGTEKVNALGYCLGGTLLGIACSVLATRKEERLVSATFLASMIDFSNIGPMGDVIDGALVRKLERGELMKDGILNGHDMERAFNLIRVNDLVWSYVINNYLSGKTPPAVDVIYWTNDNTNLPAIMYVYYMRHMILENNLSRRNALRIGNTPIDIGKINIPVVVIGLKDDHISPAATTYTTTSLVSGPVEFILGESGHVMGVVNPPSRKKYGCYLHGRLGEDYETWVKTAQYSQDSWWIPWTERLAKFSGKKVDAPLTPGNELYKPIEAAPGRFVKEKC